MPMPPPEIIAKREDLDISLRNVADNLGARFDEGIKYFRWLVIDAVLPDEYAQEICEMIAAESFFSGQVVSKPMTVFFFIPLFK